MYVLECRHPHLDEGSRAISFRDVAHEFEAADKTAALIWAMNHQRTPLVHGGKKHYPVPKRILKEVHDFKKHREAKRGGAG